MSVTSSRSGISLMELLVAVGVIAVLCALILPAVQMAREAARRVQCQHHLRQIAIALNNYCSDYGVFPSALAAKSNEQQVLLGASHHSPHARLLPYLERDTVYNQINFEFPYDLDPFDGLPVNTTGYAHHIEVFVCPSDPSELHAPPGGNNYRFSTGPIPWELPHPDGGLFAAFAWYAVSDASAGLSRIVALSERCRGDNRASRFSQGDYWYSGVDITSPHADRALHVCNGPRLSRHESTGGITWFHAGYHTTWYNHVARPNNSNDCSAFTSAYRYNMRRGVIGAQSHHPGGVFSAFADGHVSFVADTIDTAVWRSLGSRRAQGDDPGR